MTPAERTAILEAVTEAVLHCPQLTTDPRLTLGQRVQAAKQIRRTVARAITETEPTTLKGA